MGLMDYLKTQFLEIIQWEDDSRDTLSWRFPDQDKEIKNGAQLHFDEALRSLRISNVTGGSAPPGYADYLITITGGPGLGN